MKKEYEFLNDVKMDFSGYEVEDLTEMERFRMKKRFRENKKKRNLRTVSSAAASLAVLFAISQTSIAQAVIEQIISIGYSAVILDEETDTVITLPEELAGQVFDEEGNELTTVSREQERLYNAEGEEIWISEDHGTFQIEIAEQERKKVEDSEIHFSDAKEMKELLSFTLKLPSYLPEGYTLEDAYGFSEDGIHISEDFAVLVYGNGDHVFYIHERLDSDETAFVTGMTDAKEMEWGDAAAVYNDTEFMASWDGTTVCLLGHGAVAGDELLKIAESMK